MRLLEGKTAVIYGAAGGIGSSTAKAFAREGAMVFLAGRTLKPLDSLAAEISESGGLADSTTVDALDSKSVQAHLERIVASRGKLDVSYNLISTYVGMGSQLDELSEQ